VEYFIIILLQIYC